MKATELVTLSGFVAAFWKLYHNGKYSSQVEVYEHLEEIYFRRFGENRFKSFDAFRMQRDKWKHSARSK